MSLNKINRLLKRMNEDTSQDERNIRKLLSEEYQAVSDYEQFASEAQNSNVYKVFMDIAGEERVHIGELEALLDDLGMATWDEYEQGSNEVQDLLYGERDGNIITGEKIGEDFGSRGEDKYTTEYSKMLDYLGFKGAWKANFMKEYLKDPGNHFVIVIGKLWMKLKESM